MKGKGVTVRPSLMMFAVMALALASLVACSQGEHPPVGPPEKVTIAIATTTDSVLAQIAQAKGYYREEGLDATVHLQPYGKLALQEVLEGKADFATVAETPVMFAIMNGAKISVLATIESSRKGNAIVARKDRGVLTLNDLKGKKVAMIKGTTTDYFLDVLLTVNGIAQDEVTIVDMKAEEMSGALANGDIDAASMFITYAIPVQRRLGERGGMFQDENVYTFTFNLVATQEFIRNNPEKIKRLLRALVRAEEFVEKNPVEAQQVVAEFSGVDIAAIRDIWDKTSFRVSLDEMLILALEDEARWAIDDKLVGTAKVPNFLDYIYLDGLQAAAPKAVRILK